MRNKLCKVVLYRLQRLLDSATVISTFLARVASDYVTPRYY